MVARIASWAPSISAPTSIWRGPPPRSPSWGRRARSTSSTAANSPPPPIRPPRAGRRWTNSASASDRNLAAPAAEIAVMGPEGAVNIVSRRELAAAADQAATRRQKVDEFRERFANPFIAAERGYVDDCIEPRETRPRVIRALRMLENKVDTMPRKKHGNIPL